MVEAVLSLCHFFKPLKGWCSRVWPVVLMGLVDAISSREICTIPHPATVCPHIAALGAWALRPYDYSHRASDGDADRARTRLNFTPTLHPPHPMEA